MVNRRDVEFLSGGVTLRGWLYRPADTSRPSPLVVMTHGFSGVREWVIPSADTFARAGLACLVYDHPCWGASDGEPRSEIDPWRQVRAYRDAMTFASTLKGIAADRIGIWGTSLSGGHVLVVAAVDRRVRAVVSQVPASNIHEMHRRLIPAYAWSSLMSLLQADRAARYPNGSSAIIPVASDSLSTPCALPGIETYEWLMRNAATAPAWRNEITVASLDMLMEYTPEAFISRIAPTPLFMTLADGDTLTPIEVQLAVYQRALEPKQLQMLHGAHHTAYEESFEEASGAQAAFLVRQLTR
jgi:fermentation-respiration switch protein FrsA (DUF1100 family)